MTYHIYTNDGVTRIWIGEQEFTGTVEQCKNRAILEEFKKKRHYLTDNQAWKNLGVMAEADLLEISMEIMFILHNGEQRDKQNEELINTWVHNLKTMK